MDCCRCALLISTIFASIIVPSTEISTVAKLVASWQSLEWKNVTLAMPRSHLRIRRILTKLVKEASQSGIMMGVQDLEHFLAPFAEARRAKTRPEVMHSVTTLVVEHWEEGIRESVMNYVRWMPSYSVLIDSGKKANIFWREHNFTLGFYSLEGDGLLSAVLTQREHDTALFIPVGEGNREEVISGGHGITLKTSFMPFEPQVMLEAKEGKAMGMVVELMELISEFNCSFELVRHSSGLWGEPPPTLDGTVDDASGMIGEALRGEVDFMAALWFNTVERKEWFDYSMPLHEEAYYCFADANR